MKSQFSEDKNSGAGTEAQQVSLPLQCQYSSRQGYHWRQVRVFYRTSSPTSRSTWKSRRVSCPSIHLTDAISSPSPQTRELWRSTRTRAARQHSTCCRGAGGWGRILSDGSDQEEAGVWGQLFECFLSCYTSPVSPPTAACSPTTAAVSS